MSTLIIPCKYIVLQDRPFTVLICWYRRPKLVVCNTSRLPHVPNMVSDVSNCCPSTNLRLYFCSCTQRIQVYEMSLQGTRPHSMLDVHLNTPGMAR
ncbi:uncharacterized protein LOC143225576 isoform X2 [Tachypleus tridentatus]|uniref:uncharacterized protein LOC143225576 isoform X2 n=1 Tax=Tachypleus tridentatus TaxID=6853 RepID=UPI003FD2AF02